MSASAPTPAPGARLRRGRRLTAAALALAGAVAIAGCGTDRWTAASDSHVEQAVKAKIRAEAQQRQVTLTELGCYELFASKMLCTAHMSGGSVKEATTATFSANIENGRDRKAKHTFVLQGPPEIIGS